MPLAKKDVYKRQALLGCASAPSEKTRAQMRAEKADSDALMILADGLPSAPVPRDSIPIGGGVLYRRCV